MLFVNRTVLCASWDLRFLGSGGAHTHYMCAQAGSIKGLSGVLGQDVGLSLPVRSTLRLTRSVPRQAAPKV